MRIKKIIKVRFIHLGLKYKKIKNRNVKLKGELKL